MIGETISHYHILEKIGEGGMGQVYLAEDTSLKRKVALKFLPDHLYQDELAHKRFLREAESAAALDHPYICHINEVAQTEAGQDFIAMEFVEGQNLKEKLEEGLLSLEETLQISKEVADALALAHQRGIVHRDLKPANIMLTPQGHAKVMDFGLAKRVVTDDGTEQELTSGLTREGSTVGTPAYMSPEQVRAQPVDHRTDIFSFGIIFYEMLTGVHPFRRSRPVETMGAILHQEPAPLSEHVLESTPALEATIRRMLAKEPDERYQSVSEVTGDLSQPSVARLAQRRTFSWGVSALLLVVIVAAGLLGRWAFQEWSADVGGPVISSIAVLPLTNLSGDPEQEYFADGMTDALITDLCKIGALRVINRSSVMRYKKADKSLSEIAQELNVEAVMEGSVLREADQVRVGAQLIEAATGNTLWAERYERELSGIIALQGEVAQAIARQIQVTLTPGEESLLTRTQQVNPEAYEAYLKGMSHWYDWTPSGQDNALRYFELALEKDPEYALAHSGIAWVWAVRSQFAFESRTEARVKMNAALQRALELDETLAEAHALLAGVKAWGDWDWEEAETSYRRVFELNPNLANGRAYYANYLTLMRRDEEAMVQIKRALELDPFNRVFHEFYGQLLESTGRYDELIEHCQSVLKRHPNHPSPLGKLACAYYAKGMYEDALKFEKAAAEVEFGPELVQALAQGYEEGGYPGAYSRAAETRIAQSVSDNSMRRPTWVVWYYAMAGKNQEALDWLERGIDERDPNMPYVTGCARARSLRGEPRFEELLRRMNFPEDVIQRHLAAAEGTP